MNQCLFFFRFTGRNLPVFRFWDLGGDKIFGKFQKNTFFFSFFFVVFVKKNVSSKFSSGFTKFFKRKKKRWSVSQKLKLSITFLYKSDVHIFLLKQKSFGQTKTKQLLISLVQEKGSLKVSIEFSTKKHQPKLLMITGWVGVWKTIFLALLTSLGGWVSKKNWIANYLIRKCSLLIKVL